MQCQHPPPFVLPELSFPAQKLNSWLSRRRPMREKKKPSPSSLRVASLPTPVHSPPINNTSLITENSFTQSVRNKSSITATAMTARTAMAESAKSSAAAASPPPASSSSGPAKKGKKGGPKKAGPTEPKVKRTSTQPKVD